MGDHRHPELLVRVSRGGRGYSKQVVETLRRELSSHNGQVRPESATTTGDLAAEIESDNSALNGSWRPEILVIDLLPDVLAAHASAETKQGGIVERTASNLLRIVTALQARRSHLLVCNLFAYAPTEPVSFQRALHEMNIMLVRLSQEAGVRIAHVHTGMSDVGAHILQTDYRLHGTNAATITAQEIVRTLTDGHLLAEHLEAQS